MVPGTVNVSKPIKEKEQDGFDKLYAEFGM
jgi:hypothetical protein